jgi:hypothetical protein
VGPDERLAINIDAHVSLMFKNAESDSLPIHNAIKECLTQRTRKILDNWDQFSQDSDMTDNLQLTNGGPDIEAVRKLVESFVGPEAATA